jgi:Fic family protein
LGRLDGLATLLPDTSLFLYLYVRKEAVLSSQIEGTQSSLSDLLLFENEAVPGVPMDDVREVSNYVAAVQHGLDRLKEGFPLSLRLIREIHQILLRGGRGAERTPGEFRTSQNWIGGTRPGNARFVPPPPDRLMESLDSFERFLYAEELTTARQAADTAVELLRLFSEDRKRIQALGRPASSALRLHEFLQKRPLMTIAAAAAELQLSIPTVTAAMRHLVNLEIVREMTGRQRDRIFAYQRYLQVASEGTEPLRPA